VDHLDKLPEKKRCKLSANQFINVAAVESDEEEDKSDEEEDRLEERIHHPQLVGHSGKQSYQQKIDAIIEQLNRKTPEEATSIKSLKMNVAAPKGYSSSSTEVHIRSGFLLRYVL